MFEGRVFYSKENGQVYECFANKDMEEISPAIVHDLFFQTRKERVNFMMIAETQVKIFKQSLVDKSNINHPIRPESTIELYNFYGILSDEESKYLNIHYSREL